MLIFDDVVLTFDDLVLMFDICCQLKKCVVLLRLMVMSTFFRSCMLILILDLRFLL